MPDDKYDSNHERHLRNIVASLVTVLAVILSGPDAAADAPRPPDLVFGDLFVAVQSAPLWDDEKAFPDALPHASPQSILADYHRERPRSAAELKAFVAAHFTMPEDAVVPTSAPSAGANVAPGAPSLLAHIDALWDPLTRSTPQAPPSSSLLPLPEPYVVPGGRFREMYYWDSYFTMLGLEESGRRDLVTDMIRDFAHQIDAYGHIPNGTRTYYLSRSQPPFFFAMVGLLSPDEPGRAFARYLPQLKREYAFWMAGARGLGPGAARRRVVAMPDGTLLNRYWDDLATPRDESYRDDLALAASAPTRPAPELYRNIRAAAESGWDFSSRWFADPQSQKSIETTEIVPVDLNSLLFGLETAIQSGCEQAGDGACAREFAAHAATRRAAIDRYLWDEAGAAYRDYRWTTGVRATNLSAATLYPLFFGAASPLQAAAVAHLTGAELLAPGGVVTTLLETGQQWDAPNGWAPLQWIAISGLRRYGKDALAAAIACRWIVNVNDVYGRTGKLVEKYDVMHLGKSGGGGEYPTQDGFGWTNGVTRKLLALYPEDASYPSTARCPKP